MGFVVAAIVTGSISLVGIGMSFLQSRQAADTAENADQLAQANLDVQENIAKEQLAFQKEQQVKLDAQKKKYSEYQFSNPYEGMQTEFENVFEDLTVNRKQAEFEAQQGNQQRADIMQDLKGAAGSSGIAGLAQAMANQSQLQNQRISASIGMQESQNQQAMAQGALGVQRMESAADMAIRGGEAVLQQQEMSRNATLLGVEMGGMAGANAGVQQAYANQMSAGAGAVGALSSQSAAQYGMASEYMQTGTGVMEKGIGAYGAYLGS